MATDDFKTVAVFASSSVEGMTIEWQTRGRGRMGNDSRTNLPEQNHEAMRAAAMRPVSGQAATSVQAAGGGLDLPGRERRDEELPFVGMDRTRVHEPIPGEHDASTLTHRQPGAVSGAFNGEDNVQPDAAAVMEERTLRERVREGGGAEAERRYRKQGDQ